MRKVNFDISYTGFYEASIDAPEDLDGDDLINYIKEAIYSGNFETDFDFVVLPDTEDLVAGSVYFDDAFI